MISNSSFTIRKSKLVNELKKLTAATGKISKYNKSIVLELTITDNLLSLVIPGIKLEVACETTSTAKATIGLFYFKDIIQSLKGLKVLCNIFQDEIKIGDTSIKCQTTFFEDDSILRSIKLPINYTDYHLLQLENRGFTIEELRFNDLEYAVYISQKRLKKNISKTRELLSVYGVTAKEIEELIDKKIRL